MKEYWEALLRGLSSDEGSKKNYVPEVILFLFAVCMITYYLGTT